MDEKLWDWLQIATKGFSDRTSARIAMEIEAHYDESVAAHLAEGRSPVGAQAMAMEELGDAKKAARNFARKHLTEKEIRSFSEQKAAALKGPSILLVVITVLFPFALAAHLHDFLFFYLISANLFEWLSILLFRVCPRKITPQRLILLHAIRDVIGMALFTMGLSWFTKGDYFTFYMGIFCILALMTCVQHARARQKWQNEAAAE